MEAAIAVIANAETAESNVIEGMARLVAKSPIYIPYNSFPARLDQVIDIAGF